MLALFFNSSFIHSITYLFLSIILSYIGISLFFIFAFKPCTRCMPRSKRRLEEFLLYISPVGEDLSIKMFGKHAPYSVITFVNVSRSQTESYDLSGVVADEVLLEAVAPSHRAFSIFCKTGKHLVEMSPEVMAHGNHCTVYKSNVGTPSERIYAHEQLQFIEYAWHKLNKAIIRSCYS